MIISILTTILESKLALFITPVAYAKQVGKIMVKRKLSFKYFSKLTKKLHTKSQSQEVFICSFIRKKSY